MSALSVLWQYHIAFPSNVLYDPLMLILAITLLFMLAFAVTVCLHRAGRFDIPFGRRFRKTVTSALNVLTLLLSIAFTLAFRPLTKCGGGDEDDDEDIRKVNNRFRWRRRDAGDPRLGAFAAMPLAAGGVGV